MARLTLEVTSVEEPKPFGKQGAQQVRFKAKGEDGKELQYFTTARSLFPSIVLGPLDCDVDITQREWEGNTYTDRKVSQIYKDGQPVKAEGFSEKGGGQRSYGKSPETVRLEHELRMIEKAMERRSIQAQTGVIQLIAAKAAGITVPSASLDAAIHLLDRWIAMGIHDAIPLIVGQVSHPAPSPIPPETHQEGFYEPAHFTGPRTLILPETPQEGQETASETPDYIPGRSEAKPRQFADRGGFFQAAFKELGYSPSQVNRVLGIGKDEPIADLTKAWSYLVESKG